MIDPVTNNALRIVTGCLLPTPTDYQMVLAGIPPTELRRRQATVTLARQALEPNHLLDHKIIQPKTQAISAFEVKTPFCARCQRTTIQSQPTGHQGR